MCHFVWEGGGRVVGGGGGGRCRAVCDVLKGDQGRPHELGPVGGVSGASGGVSV